jgi:hypothetical protein
LIGRTAVHSEKDPAFVAYDQFLSTGILQPLSRGEVRCGSGASNWCGSQHSRFSPLILKRASASRPSGEWNDDDFDVLAASAVVGRIFKANADWANFPGWIFRAGTRVRAERDGEYQMAGVEELTALRESLAELRRKEAYVLCDNPSAGIDRLVQIHLAIQAIDAVIDGETTPKLDPDAVVP